MNYERDVEIDETALDVEWLNQPALALRYGRNWANLKKQVALKEEEIKITRSELIKEANETLDKPTGPNVEAYYREHSKHKKLKQQLIELEYDCDIALIAKQEISHSRKVALENLVRLHGQNYFAGPSIPRDLTREAEQRQSQQDSDAKVARTFKRTKK